MARKKEAIASISDNDVKRLSTFADKEDYKTTGDYCLFCIHNKNKPAGEKEHEYVFFPGVPVQKWYKDGRYAEGYIIIHHKTKKITFVSKIKKQWYKV